jgi:hypothetical protein
MFEDYIEKMGIKDESGEKFQRDRKNHVNLG